MGDNPRKAVAACDIYREKLNTLDASLYGLFYISLV